MIVGEDGKIIPYSKIRKVIIFLVLLLVLSLAAAAATGFLFVRQQDESTHLRSKIKELQSDISELKNEKDLLLTRLVIAEARLNPPKPSEKKKAETKKTIDTRSSANPARESVGQAAVIASAEKRAESTAVPVNKKKSRPQVEKEPDKSAQKIEKKTTKVEIEAFKAVYQSSNNLLRAGYRIRNKAGRSFPVSGKTLLVLTHTSKENQRWISLPKVPLTDGEPSGKKGAIFKIANYKNFSLKTEGPEPPFSFDRGIVYIFDNKGKVILKKEYPLSIAFGPSKPVEIPRVKEAMLRGGEAESSQTTENDKALSVDTQSTEENTGQSPGPGKGTGNADTPEKKPDSETVGNQPVDPEVDAMFNAQ